ncbi:precorrin-3B synthase [Parasedimentitalea psychrophila]|uniref:Precorrin-3B synthase n=1 Tax=Parasedimentitalea psychrophila TaxID=2997337 RepID=A0A9Y2P4S1_9RHOB|nr:precorrin-3B synthase [Parasedimentitalea psychrophila]WIY25619.1 precorrin-3B synthase [Parasedimentitalea psychrophila]
MNNRVAPKVYGWCPGALRPMMSGDGLVVRIRAPLGRLSGDQAQAVADLSHRFGNGILDLSSRANLQMRGVSEEDHAPLVTALQDLGLVDADAATESRRNVLVAPFWAAGDQTHSLAQQLSDALVAATDLPLPGKFGFAVDTGPAPVLRDTAADIRIERNPDGLVLIADGADRGLAVTPTTAAAEALSLARWFLTHGGAPDGRGRMRPLIARRAPPSAHGATLTAAAPQQRLGQIASGRLVGLEFGQIPATSFAALAAQGALRLTPWRMLLVEHATDLPPLPGLILDAADPRLQVSACTGAPGCLQALSNTRNLARDLAPSVPPGRRLHVSGCAKGCAHPGAAPLTLTATGADTFNLIYNGTASDQPAHLNLSASQLRAAPDILTKGS